MVHQQVIISPCSLKEFFFFFKIVPINVHGKMFHCFLSVNVDKNDTIWSEDVKLRVNTNGHVLHVFVNGGHAGKFD